MAKTDSYVVTLELELTPEQEKYLRRCENVVREIENGCKGLCLRRLRGLRSDPRWRHAAARFGELHEKKKKTAEEKAELELVQITIGKLKRKFHLTEYQLHEDAAEMRSHFGKTISINEAQKAATRAFRAFERLRKGEAHRLNYKRRGMPVTIENKSNSFGFREKDGKLLGLYGFAAKFRIDPKDLLAQDTFKDRTKYVRIYRREIRGRWRWFCQLVKEGTPRRKPKTAVGQSTHPVGCDQGPSSVAAVVAATHEALIAPLPTGVNEREEKRIRHDQKVADRALRLNNPDCFDEKNNWIKGKKAVRSKTYERRQARARNLRRKQVVRRTQEANKLSKCLIAMGVDIRTEDHGFKSMAARSKETTINKKNGKINSKKRFGSSILRHAPAAFRSTTAQKLAAVILPSGERAKLGLVRTEKLKASQLDPLTGEYRKKKLSERWTEVGGRLVQRDLLSAFILAHTTGEKLDTVDLEACRRDWSAFLEAHDAAIKAADKKSLKGVM
ncbi:hypothetical protein [Sutterella megalosphaeroides]|uniref:Transposase n=1 Tax=Sutterella megalosphaeroides TaxID=2494234 RepID=A0A2Z6I961_9BURK|nr:hypothetical protein [Sutterella megalosphaeroides]BBF23001.1 hypothetical protein SUTMEG_08920 [Sutterella megalosphaeroides]